MLFACFARTRISRIIYVQLIKIRFITLQYHCINRKTPYNSGCDGNNNEYGNNNSEIELTYDKWYHQSTEKDFSGKVVELDKTEKLGECVPEEYKSEDGNQKLDYTCGTWTNDEFEYLKNEDGTDIKGND